MLRSQHPIEKPRTFFFNGPSRFVNQSVAFFSLLTHHPRNPPFFRNLNTLYPRPTYICITWRYTFPFSARFFYQSSSTQPLTTTTTWYTHSLLSLLMFVARLSHFFFSNPFYFIDSVLMLWPSFSIWQKKGTITLILIYTTHTVNYTMHKNYTSTNGRAWRIFKFLRSINYSHHVFGSYEKYWI